MEEKHNQDETPKMEDLQIEPLSDEELEDAAGGCWSIFCCSCEDCSGGGEVIEEPV